MQPANLRFDTDPKQRRFAPLFGAGQARRSASRRVVPPISATFGRGRRSSGLVGSELCDR